MRLFLRGLDDLANELPPEQQQRFEFYVNDAQSARLLADYADTVVRTRSETVIGTLAILYADYENRMMTSDFKAGAIRAFDGLPETRIDAFLRLMEACRADELTRLPSSSGHRIFTIADESEPTIPQRLREWSSAGHRWVDAISDFMTRGLVSPDRSRLTGLISQSASWSCVFTVARIRRRITSCCRRPAPSCEAARRSKTPRLDTMFAVLDVMDQPNAAPSHPGAVPRHG